jgi:isopenicillin N synthase-like dioxygenase
MAEHASTTADGFVPVIDIAPYLAGDEEGKRQVAEQVDRACREVGFYVITGHGVSEALLGEVERVARGFFDLPVEEKMKVHVGDAPGGVGYSALGDTSLSYTQGVVAPADLNESFQIAKVDCGGDAYFKDDAVRALVPDNKWPAQLPDMQSVLTAYYERMGELARDLLRVSALALDLPEAYFDPKIGRHISRLNLRLYPQQTEAPLPGQLRAAAHTDYGTVTILRPGDSVGGLQVLDREGNWHDVPSVPNSFVINQGDVMARWTNDEWLSTMHRVANPPAEAQGGSRRLSVVFFHHPDYDTTIECLPTCTEAGKPPRHAPIRVHEYYTLKRTQQRAAKEKAKAQARLEAAE